ncbi:hypothetical protein LX64_00895 [Chitinophaga skermanii]|uniref:Catalase n=1 Tax=Chitinophaga skermanii TaxID=331697 RepID=A0A327QWH8_9BACT|nr:hypothetical protein [Chitinophaga skermanii]RAJ08248.1 hypothetical protein LX64_00895 [Chitinophaga skermanii]
MHLLSSHHNTRKEKAVDCDQNPTASLKEMFIDIIQFPRALDGQCPVRRPVFSKQHGMVKATWERTPNLPIAKQVGVFKHERLDAWLRFSSDTKVGLGDLKSTIGLGIKLFGVPGEKLLESEHDALTADFILQNHDVFFVPNATEMCKFTHAGVILRDYNEYLKDHPITDEILTEMEKEEPSALMATFGSCLPYAFGTNNYVKYKVVALEPAVTKPIPKNNPCYLRDELKQSLIEKSWRFGFYVQFQSGTGMPIDDATVRWDEQVSPPELFATLTLHQQDIDAPGQVAYGENLSYNPWHTLAEHAPADSIGAVRKVVYEEGARLRRNRNGIALTEPRSARQ